MLWLDIEHTDRKRYFTWNEDFFPDPVAACYLVITPCYLVINKRYPITTPPRCACSRRSHALAARW